MTADPPGFDELRPPAIALILASMTGNTWTQQTIIRRYAASDTDSLALLLTVAMMAGAMLTYAAGLDDVHAQDIARMTLADATARRAGQVTGT